MSAADSTVRQVSQLQKQENNFKAQLDQLKAAASDANNAAIAAAQQAAAGAGRLPGGQAGDGGLRARLEGAVAAMQAGLIERDTEVGALRGCLCQPWRLLRLGGEAQWSVQTLCG